MSHELKHSLVAVDSGTLQLVKDTPLSDLLKPLQEEILLDDRCIAGTTHLPDQSCLEELKPGDWLIMEREDNPWDEHRTCHSSAGQPAPQMRLYPCK